MVSAAWTAGTYQGAVPRGISAVPNGNIRDVSGRCLSAISPVSKRTITHFTKMIDKLSKPLKLLAIE